MPRTFWYISTGKISALRGGKVAALEKIEIKIKLPWMETSTSSKFNTSLVRDLEAVERDLDKRADIYRFEELKAGETPVIFKFEGPAARMIHDDKYWVTIDVGTTALLLAGSASNAVLAGAEADTKLSPSVDPVGAVTESFIIGGVPQSKSEILSYAWQEIRRELSGLALPRVKGFGFFAGSCTASKRQMRRAGYDHLTLLVVGSPIFIEQI
jgi:hypothetical protein